MEASREFSRAPPRLPPCSDVSVFQKTRMSHFWDTHHMSGTNWSMYSRERDAHGEIGGVKGHSRSRVSALHPEKICR